MADSDNLPTHEEILEDYVTQLENQLPEERRRLVQAAKEAGKKWGK